MSFKLTLDYFTGNMALVKAASIPAVISSFLKLESGSYILLEDGSKLKLEG